MGYCIEVLHFSFFNFSLLSASYKKSNLRSHQCFRIDFRYSTATSKTHCKIKIG